MANVALTPTAFGFVPGQPGAILTGASLTPLVVATTTLTFPNPSGNVILVVSNLGAGAVTIAPVIVRTVEQQTPIPAPITVAAGTVQAIGPFPPNDFNVANIVTCNVTGGLATLVTAGAFQMTVAPAQI